MKLFLEDPPVRTKVAGQSLSADPTGWHREILDELYTSYPYLSDYVFLPTFKKVDSATGTAVGHLALQAGPGVEPRKLAHVLIPLIVKQGELSPLDILLVGDRARPLTRGTFEEAVLRPELALRPEKGGLGDAGVLSQLWPPPIQRYGGLSGGSPMFASSKSAQLRSDRVLYWLPLQEGRAQWGPDPTRWGKIRVKAASVPAHVVQIARGHGGIYSLRAAPVTPGGLRKEGWVQHEVSRPEVRRLLDGRPERLAELDQNGHITVSPVRSRGGVGGLVKSAELLQVGVAPQSAPNGQGIGLVREPSGRVHLGGIWSLCLLGPSRPRRRDSFLFTNGSVWAEQESVAFSSLVGRSDSCTPEGAFGPFPIRPTGTGVWVTRNSARGPVTILEELEDPTYGKGWGVKTPSGRLRVYQQQLYEDSPALDGIMFIPKDSQWLPLEGKRIELVQDVREFTKLAHVRSAKVAQVGPDSYQVRYLDETLGGVMDRRSAEIMLGLLGYDAGTTKLALDRADAHLPVDLSDPVIPGRPVGKLPPHFVRKTQEALQREYFGPIKEAAEAVGDRATVDTILKLEALSPESYETYIRGGPEVRKLASRMAEMLLAVRLGMGDVPETQLKRAMLSLEAVAEGLQSLGLEVARQRG